MESLEKVLLILVGVVILSLFLCWVIPNFERIDEYRRDNDAPIWDQTPKDQIIKYGESLSYDINASDISGIDYYWISDKSNFIITTFGLIVSKPMLDLGQYWIEIRAYDPYDNFISAEIKITVKN